MKKLISYRKAQERYWSLLKDLGKALLPLVLLITCIHLAWLLVPTLKVIFKTIQNSDLIQKANKLEQHRFLYSKEYFK
jgi:hypothetical protein